MAEQGYQAPNGLLDILNHTANSIATDYPEEAEGLLFWIQQLSGKTNREPEIAEPPVQTPPLNPTAGKGLSPLVKAYHAARTSAGIPDEVHQLFKLRCHGHSSKQWTADFLSSVIAQIEAGPTNEDRDNASWWDNALWSAFRNPSAQQGEELFRRYLKMWDIPQRIWTIHLCWLKLEALEISTHLEQIHKCTGRGRIQLLTEFRDEYGETERTLTNWKKFAQQFGESK